MYLIKFKSGQTYLSKAFSDLQEDDCIPEHLRCISVYDFVALKSINVIFLFCIFTMVNTLYKKKNPSTFPQKTLLFMPRDFFFFFNKITAVLEL